GKLPSLPPFTKNPKFRDAGRPLTAEHLAGSFNNFYEFSADKDDVKEKAKNFRVRPWTLEIGGLVSKPKTWAIDDLLKTFPLEERVYRFRCVEAWAMTVPWIGFPLAKLLAAAEPKPEGKFVRFISLEDSGQMPSQRWRLWAPWPYREGLRTDEAMNELALLTVGIYGHSLPNQHGAPLRLVTPWKYGFKSAKSIVRIELVEKQPATFWNDAAADEYGFYSNVNPDVPHPRWSQKSERRLGDLVKNPTVIYNGYGPEVAHLYKDLKQSPEGPPI
ncbi:MAG: protein-methionine-sulfoxide reductase catalytic subunit MsrP, partial [Bdellovibrionota bacterium]